MRQHHRGHHNRYRVGAGLRAWRAAVTLVTVGLFLVALTPAADAQLSPGDILATVETDVGTDFRGALFQVNPQTGSRSIFSDFGDSTQGDLGKFPFEVVVEAVGTVLVVDGQSGTDFHDALFRVDPQDGRRTLLSDFGNSSQGPLVGNPCCGGSQASMAVEASGAILVTDIQGGTNARGALLRVNAQTGQRTFLSDFGNLSQGPLGRVVRGVAVEASAAILVSDSGVGMNELGVLFRVNAQTGQRTLLSDFGNLSQGPLGRGPRSVEVEASGTILVIHIRGENGRGALFRVDPQTGQRTLLSDFAIATQGDLGAAPIDLAVEASGAILVSDFEAGTDFKGAIFRVDPQTGFRTLLSDFGDPAQGTLGFDLALGGIAVVP